MTTAEIVAIVISGISLLITTILTIIQVISGKKCNDQNLKANLIKDMYAEALMIKIPQGREYIFYNDKRITGVDKLIDAVSSVRRSSLYFKATSNEYYEKIRSKCQELEDYLNSATKEYTSPEFKDFMNEVDNKIDAIFELIGNEYSGKH